ncbi:MAG: hypothetical protein M1458_01780 [Deltaproteobacteria bacterium]|nr:hypothetical protein [Deltaproteobacteria bacterium]
MSKKFLFLYVDTPEIGKDRIMHKVAENLKRRGLEVKEIIKSGNESIIFNEILWSDVPIVVKGSGDF